MKRQCKTCKDDLPEERVIPICLTCRWLFSSGVAVGGFIVGAIAAVIKLVH